MGSRDEAKATVLFGYKARDHSLKLPQWLEIKEGRNLIKEKNHMEN